MGCGVDGHAVEGYTLERSRRTPNNSSAAGFEPCHPTINKCIGVTEMKYWFDFEFEEDGITINPISVGFICEDGREYYAEFEEYDRYSAPEWLYKNVLPLLDGPVKSREIIAAELVGYLGDYPEIWGWYGSYDWVALCQLYGPMVDLPDKWPFFQLETMNYVTKDFVQPIRKTPGHHALLDEVWQKEVWEKLFPHGNR